MTTIPERVAKGAQFLDASDPDWWRAGVPNSIDLDRLDIASCAKCVLGQRCPSETTTPFSEQLRNLTGMSVSEDVDLIDDWVTERGFDSETADEHDDLTAEWRRVIETRRSA